MTVYISMGYDERNASSTTSEVAITDDTRPGQIVPVPVAGPSFSPKVRHVGDGDFVLSAFTLYYNTMRLTS